MSKITSYFNYSPKAVAATESRDEGHRAVIIAAAALGAAALLTPELPNFVIDTPNRMHRVEELMRQHQNDEWYDPLGSGQLHEDGNTIPADVPASTYHFDPSLFIS